MSNYIRPKTTGATIYFSVNLAEHGSRLLTDEILHLRAAVRMTRAARPFHINAWVVLPDHMHAIWTLPQGDRDFSARWGAIKARFTRAVKSKGKVGLNPTLRRSASQVIKGDGGIWQRRFWEHHIRNDADYEAHIQHCWLNPVKHGLVMRPEDWPYSSIHRDIHEGRFHAA